MFIDIMFVDSDAFLISVTQPLGLTMINELGRTRGSRNIQSVRSALQRQIAPYKAKDFRISTIHTDGEGAVASISNELQTSGIEVNPSGPGQHVAVFEGKIRGNFNTLPYKLPATLLVWLICFVVSRINIIPHRGGPTGISPREAFLGRKTFISVVDLENI